MTTLSNAELQTVMLNLYPKRKVVRFDEEIHEHNYQIDEDEPLFEQPMILSENNEGVRKWKIALILSIASLILFSSFFLNFVDELCITKNISVFDEKGEPKLMLLACIGIVLFLFNRLILGIL